MLLLNGAFSALEKVKSIQSTCMNAESIQCLKRDEASSKCLMLNYVVQLQYQTYNMQACIQMRRVCVCVCVL